MTQPLFAILNRAGNVYRVFLTPVLDGRNREIYVFVLTLKFILGYRDKEIAEILGIPENTVGVRIHRGRKQLIAMLKEEGEHEESVDGRNDL